MLGHNYKRSQKAVARHLHGISMNVGAAVWTLGLPGERFL